MNPDRILLLKKYLISTVACALFFSVLSWILTVQLGPYPTFYYFLPIGVVSILIYRFYFKRFKGFFNRNGSKERGGIFFVALVYFAGIVVMSMAAVNMTDEYDQKVTVLETPDQIVSDHSEYIHINHYAVNREEMVSGWNYSSYAKNGVTTNKLEFGGYVPLVKRPTDSISRFWVKFQFRTSKTGTLSEAETHEFQNTQVAQYISQIKHLNYDSIVFFSKMSTQYNRLPDKSGETNAEILFLIPSYETLEGELKDDAIYYSMFYLGSIVMFVFASMFVEKAEH